MGIGYQSFAFSGPFRTKGGDPNDTEWVESSLGLVHLTGSILWEAKFAEQLAFQYGVGLDLGIVTGELKRTEAYQNAERQLGQVHRASAPGIYCVPPIDRSDRQPTPTTRRASSTTSSTRSVPPVFGAADAAAPRAALHADPGTLACGSKRRTASRRSGSGFSARRIAPRVVLSRGLTAPAAA